MDEMEITLETGEILTVEELLDEYHRLRRWCAVALGEDISKIGGKTVD